MDVLTHNREAWNRLCRGGCRWTQPVSSRTIQEARLGKWEVALTPNLPVPGSWFGELAGKRVLCLASGGGQQVPILAAAGGEVVSFDLSEEQLARDQFVADRDGLSIRCVQGDMADLSVLGNEEFDLVFNPISTVFIPEVKPVWRECFRVLRPGGNLLSGFMNPSFFLFDHEPLEVARRLEVKYRLPYSESDPGQLSPGRKESIAKGEAVEFSHSLASLVGGQLEVGFVLVALYEDWWDDEATPLNGFSPTSIATLASRP